MNSADLGKIRRGSVGEQGAEALVFWRRQFGVILNHNKSRIPGLLHESGVFCEIADAKRWEAALSGSEQVTRAPEFPIGFRDVEAIGGLFQDLQFMKGFGFFGCGEEDTIAFVDAAAHTSPELMELCETKTFCVLDEHDGGVWDVDTDFDDGGGYECFGVAKAELFHDGLFFLGWRATVQESAGHGGKELLPFLEFRSRSFGLGFF